MSKVEWQEGDSSGVWSPYRSIYLFTEKHYSIEQVSTERASFQPLAEGEERDLEEIVEAFGPLYSNSGSYEIRGDSIFYTAHVAKNPNFMNDNPNWSRQITVGADTLTSVVTEENGTATYIYTRMD